MFLNSTFFLSGFIMNILSVILSIYMIYQVMNKANSEDTRLLYLAGVAFQMGFLVGPAIHTIADLHPEILLQAVLYTAAAFISFSLVSLLSKRRSYLFLGSIIATIVQGMILYRTFNWLFGYGFYGHYGLPYLMLGLLMACMYIIYDTQIIVERAERGDKDVPTHTLMLFVDLFQLFIKILQILMELQKNEKKDERRRRWIY